MNIEMRKDIAEERISDALGIKIGNFYAYSDGFSFTVDTELEAYKAAYKYHGPSNRLVVKYASAIDKWIVQLYELGDKND